MIIEYLVLDDNFELLTNLDLSNIDKLFVNLYAINRKYFHITLDCLKLFLNLDTNKIVLLTEFNRYTSFVKSADDLFIPFEAWPGIRIEVNHSYQWKNYNFIFSANREEDFISQLKDTTNIILSRGYDEYLFINDRLRRLDSENFVDIIIYKKTFEWRKYLVYTSLGITFVSNRYAKGDLRKLHLVDNKVYLKF